jgi:hypothetical protein
VVRMLCDSNSIAVRNLPETGCCGQIILNLLIH